MDIAYMLDIVKAGIASVGAVTKWNEANPEELIVIPAIYLED